jgi:hypothetical protein
VRVAWRVAGEDRGESEGLMDQLNRKIWYSFADKTS